MNAVLQELVHAALITSLVFVMMALVELATVLTHGRVTTAIRGRPFRQYLLASFLGVTPGCAGVYLVDSMYSRGALSIGAVTAALLATAGDEAFLMLAMIPATSAVLLPLLFLIGLIGGWLSDLALPRLGLVRSDPCLMAELHEEDLAAPKRPQRWWPPRIRRTAPLQRTVLVVILLVLVVGLLGGFQLHHDIHGIAAAGHQGRADVETILFAAVGILGILLVVFAPGHYVKEHLWRHLALHHAPRIFAWTAGTLVAVHLLATSTSLATVVAGRGPWLLIGAALIGLIPQSGPHLIVVTLFASGSVPFSVLLANSIVQDGHGLLPLLGIAPRDAIVAKAANLVIGLALGAALMAMGG